MLFEKKFIKLKEGQDLDDYINELKIGSIYYMNNADGSYTEYTLVPIKKEYVGQQFDDTKCQILKSVMSVFTPTVDLDLPLTVDLDLPSGTLWATMNVGASKPSDAGLYFQWGDTVGYTADQVRKNKQFTWNDYKFSIDGSSSNFSKYNTTGATLELEDDAAHVNMGGDWHMPTPTQIQELIDNTTSDWTTLDGVSGMTFTSKKDTSKSIFIPAAGVAWDGSLNVSGSYGRVWSSMLDAYRVGVGQNLVFNSNYVDLSNYGRCYGFSVRGVIG